MRSRYLLPDLQDLPDFIECHYKEVTKEIIDLTNELEEIKASPNTQQKKKEIQKKLLDILLLTISDGEKAKELHFRSILRLSTGLRRLERIKEEL
jgi:hypothetical protein